MAPAAFMFLFFGEPLRNLTAPRGLRLVAQHRRSRYLNNRLERDHDFQAQRLLDAHIQGPVPATPGNGVAHSLV